MDIHGYIHIHRRLSCVHIARKFLQNTTKQERHFPPPTRRKHFPPKIVKKINRSKK